MDLQHQPLQHSFAAYHAYVLVSVLMLLLGRFLCSPSTWHVRPENNRTIQGSELIYESKYPTTEKALIQNKLKRPREQSNLRDQLKLFSNIQSKVLKP